MHTINKIHCNQAGKCWDATLSFIKNLSMNFGLRFRTDFSTTSITPLNVLSFFFLSAYTKGNSQHWPSWNANIDKTLKNTNDFLLRVDQIFTQDLILCVKRKKCTYHINMQICTGQNCFFRGQHLSWCESIVFLSLYFSVVKILSKKELPIDSSTNPLSFSFEVESVKDQAGCSNWLSYYI